MWSRFASLLLLTVVGGCATLADPPPRKATTRSTDECEAEHRAHQSMSQPLPPTPAIGAHHATPTAQN
jgi:hypothetical protein